MQNPQKMLHLLISQYISGIYGLPVKGIDSKRGIFHQVLIYLHSNMNKSYIFQEYSNLLKYDELKATNKERKNLHSWVCFFVINNH